VRKGAQIIAANWYRAAQRAAKVLYCERVARRLDGCAGAIPSVPVKLLVI